MTLRAAQPRMFAVQGETGAGMIEVCPAPALGGMTRPAVCAETTVMVIV